MSSIVDNIRGLSATANTTFARADKLIADNSDAIRSTFEHVDAFARTLADNRANVDEALKGLADLGKRIEPLVARLQSLSDDADKIVKAIDAEKVQSIVGNAQTFSDALAASSNDYKALVRDGAAFAARLNDTSKQLNEALADADAVLKALDATKIAGIVDSVSDVATTVRENRGNIDQTIKNAAEMIAKLNNSADKVDGLIDQRPELPRLARHEERARADRRRGAVGQEARRRPRRAGEGDCRRPQPVQQFGLEPIRGARRPGPARA